MFAAEGRPIMWNLLEEARKYGWLVRIRRENLESGSIYGFVGALSSDLVAVSLVDINCRFDGVRVFETDEVTFLQWDTAYLRSRARVLAESPTSPIALGHVDLESWETAVRSIAAVQPVVSFHRDRADSSTCFIGTNIRIAGDCVRADELSFNGIVDGHFALCLSDLTQIEFGDGYDLALWQMVRNARSDVA
jgi:hypothetical protein